MSKMLEEIRRAAGGAGTDAAPGAARRGEAGAGGRAKHSPKLIVLAARGTSDNAAQFGRYLLEITTGIPVSLAAPSIYTLYDARID